MSTNSVHSADSFSHKSRLNKRQINSKERTFIQRRGKPTRNINLDSDHNHNNNNHIPSLKEINYDSIIANKNMIEGFLLESKIPPYSPSLVTRYRAIDLHNDKKVIIKHSPYSLDQTSPLAKFLNEWFLLSGDNAKVRNPNWMDSVSNFGLARPLSLPKDIRGILYPMDFHYSPDTGSSALIYDNEHDLRSLKEKYVLPADSPKFLAERSPSSSSIKSMASGDKQHMAVESSKRVIYKAPAEMVEILEVIICTLKTLKRVHDLGFTNNGLTTAAILVDSKGEVYIEGWDFAFTRPAENCRKGYRATNKDLINWLLPYMSPEATGSFNKDCDYKSDFYSVGIILYELLVGFLPFQSSEASKIIYQHIYQTPVAPCTVAPWVSERLSNVIMRCLEKLAINRFDDCNELINELVLCIDELCGGTRSTSDQNYPYHVNARFLNPKNNYNRKADLDKLTQQYEQLPHGVSTVVVTGEKGAGKTSILGDFRTYLVGKRGMLYAEWNHQKFRNSDSSYIMFISIIRQVLAQILSSPAKIQKKWKDIIARRIDDDLSIVADILPELKQLIGTKHLAINTTEKAFVGENQLDVLPAKFEARFEYIIKHFFSIFASNSAEGLTIILDDDQFAQNSERVFLAEITSFVLNRVHTKASPRIRIVSSMLKGEAERGTYRCFSTPAPDFRVLPKNVPIFYVELSPLTYEAVQQYFADFLPPADFPRQDYISRLIYDEFLYHKTPLVLRTTLARLVLTNTFAIRDDKMAFDFDNAMKACPNDLDGYYTGFCGELIRRDGQNILKYAACICAGSAFSLLQLSIVTGLSIADAYTATFEPLSTNLIVPLGINYKVPFHLLGGADESLAGISEEKIVQMASTCMYEFAHDTLQDFILAELMRSNELKQYHRLCALRLYDRIENMEDLNYSRLIHVTRHFIESIEVAIEEDYEIYSEVLIMGGKLAYDNYDFELALLYFQAAKRFTVVGSDEEEVFEVTKRIDLTIVQLLFVIGNYEQCLQLIDELVPHYEDTAGRNSFLLMKAKALFALNRTEEGVTVSLDSLRMLGVDLEEDEEWNLAYHAELDPRIPRSVSEIRSLGATPAKSDTADDLIKAEIVANALFALILTKRPALSRSLIFVGIIDIIENGWLPSHGLILIVASLFIFAEDQEVSFMRSIEYTNVALKMVQDGDTPLDLGTTIYEIYCCSTAIYVEPFEVVSKYFDVFIGSNRSFTDSFLDIHAFLCLGIKNTSMVIDGVENLNFILLKNSNRSAEAKLYFNTDATRIWNELSLNFLKCLIGTLSLSQFKLSPDIVTQSTLIQDQYQYVYHVMKMALAFLFAEYETALTVLVDELPQYDHLFPITCFKVIVVYFGSLLLLKYPGRDEETQLKRSAILKSYLKYLETWSNSVPANFETKYLLVKAVLNSKKVDGASSIDTLDRFELVIEKSAAKGHLLDEALAFELCAEWMLQNSTSKSRAARFMKEAIRVYNLWGSSAKVAKLSEEYHDLVHDYNWAGVDLLSPSSDHNSPAATKTASSAPFQLLLSNFFKNEQAVHTSSDETDDDEKLKNMRRSSSESTVIDMKTALRTCLEISEAVDFHTIFTKLVENTMSLVDSDFAVVVMKDRVGDLYLECAVSNKTVRIIDHEPLNSRNDICPISLVQDTINKGRIINREDDPIFFDNNYTDQDYYYQSTQPVAAVCIPIRDQHEVVGALYLESQQYSRSKTKCFNGEKIDVAVLFCTQAAFSLYKATLYQQMNIATRAANAATEEKANFLNSMSHEIRTPFNSLLSCAVFLLDTELTDVQKDYVETIKSSSMVTLNIIDGILSFAKIENSSIVLEEMPFSVNDCIESAFQLVSEQASAKDLELVHFNTCKDIDTIYDDKTRFTQVIVNIVGNAVKFTPKGHIVIETRCRQVSVDNRYEFDIIVKDTGIGIPKDSHSKVFGAFSQVDGSARRVYGGAGLGLAISKRIVDIMGGTLTFESEENKGTTFTFSLIMRAEETQQKRVEADHEIGRGKKVLVVDHHDLTRKSLCAEVENYGFEVTGLNNLEKAYGLFQKCTFEFAFIHKHLVDDSREHEALMDKVFALAPNTKFILMGPFGTIDKKKFNRILLLPFARAKVLEMLSSSKPKSKAALAAAAAAEKFDINQPLTKEVMATLAETHPLNILLVEDNMINTKVTLQHLKRMGYEADHAGDGAIALQRCADRVADTGKNYDVVLMDIQMPNMDGIESCTKIMELYKDTDLCPEVIALTANVIGEDRNRCISCGMSGFLSKPLLPNDLAKALLSVEV